MIQSMIPPGISTPRAIVGTQIEGFQGDKRRVQIECDNDDSIVSVKGNVQSKG